MITFYNKRDLKNWTAEEKMISRLAAFARYLVNHYFDIMKKASKHFLVGLMISMSIGFSLGVMISWADVRNYAPLWCTIGFGLFYLHVKWIKNVNKNKNDVKIKQMI